MLVPQTDSANNVECIQEEKQYSFISGGQRHIVLLLRCFSVTGIWRESYDFLWNR